MEKKLELLEREFSLFESRVKEVKKLKRILYLLDTQGFEKDAAIIEEKLLDMDNIPKARKLIDNLKVKIEKKAMEAGSKLSHIIGEIFECNGHIGTISREKLNKEYRSIYRKYSLLSRKEKVLVYNSIMKLHKKLKEK